MANGYWLPDVTVVRDDMAGEARRFGAVTSGQTLLFDTQGNLLFSGGITAARAQAGDNAGRASSSRCSIAGRPTRDNGSSGAH